MAKTIKTREVVKDIRTHDSAANVGGRVKDIGIKTKDAVSENINETDAVSPEQYATDKITDETRQVTEATAIGTNKVADKVTSKTTSAIKKRIKEKAETSKPQNNQPKNNIKQKKSTPPKTKQQQTVKNQTKPKTVRQPNHSKIKQTKRSTQGASKTIKTSKNSVKGANRTVKTAKSTTKTTAETAKRTKQLAQASAKAAVKAAKATVHGIKLLAKAIVAAGKAIVAGVKSLVGIIAAGGVPAVIAIIVICLIGGICATCFGIFLANDDSSGTDITMSEAISQITSEHYAEITELQNSYTYDSFELTGATTINWKDILSVYAVKTTTSDDALEVVTMDETKLDLLRQIKKDMNVLSGSTSQRQEAVVTVTTDENGNSVKTVTYETKTVLTITITQKTATEASDMYNFNETQKQNLAEIMSAEYDDLWAGLIGASGNIIQTGSSFVGIGMFTWPFENDQSITSFFGTRSDPFTGEVRTHGGTDIAATLGTPILAAADGVVEIATWSDSYGYYVKIRHDDTFSTLYGHASALRVTQGQTVKQGQVIADCGSTGRSTGPHLHFEVIQNGIRVDALNYFKQ